jgi:acetoacetate decarboxylase
MSFVKTYDEILEHTKESADFYDAEMLTLIWETEPEAIERLLPPPLEPAEIPGVVAFLANYPSTNFSLPYLESALLIRASFEGQEGFYCLSMPVTNRRWRILHSSVMATELRAGQNGMAFDSCKSRQS